MMMFYLFQAVFLPGKIEIRLLLFQLQLLFMIRDHVRLGRGRQIRLRHLIGQKVYPAVLQRVVSLIQHIFRLYLQLQVRHHGAGVRHDEEREKMTRLLDAGFVDTFRTLYPDKTGAYSWWSYRFNARKNNAGWRIDYFIVSERLRDRIKNADIWSEVTGSDHCPVVLEI